jgi:hypothetical protein
MPLLVADCPRCKSGSITFDVFAQTFRTVQHGWQTWYEVFSVCRKCHGSTIFIVAMKSESYHQRSGESVTGEQLMQYKASLNDLFSVERYISIRDEAHHRPPEFLSDELASAFTEGATGFSVACSMSPRRCFAFASIL